MMGPKTGRASVSGGPACVVLRSIGNGRVAGRVEMDCLRRFDLSVTASRAGGVEMACLRCFDLSITAAGAGGWISSGG
jgi:hypothetical protein